MKKIFLTLSIVFTGLLFSCDETEDPQIYEGESIAYFTNGVNGNFFVEDTDESTIEIPVGVTKTSSSDRTFTVAINESETTATDDQYDLVSTTFTIPANEYFGYIEVVGYFDAIPTTGTVLAIDLVDISEGELASFDTTFLLTLNQFCPFDIPTTYAATASIGSDPVNTFTVELMATGNLNEYEITNAWGDFVAAATGDPSFEGQYPYPVIIQIGCDTSITVTPTPSNGIPDAGGSGSYNEGTGNINLVLSQGLFTQPFDVNVQLTPQ